MEKNDLKKTKVYFDLLKREFPGWNFIPCKGTSINKLYGYTNYKHGDICLQVLKNGVHTGAFCIKNSGEWIPYANLKRLISKDENELHECNICGENYEAINSCLNCSYTFCEGCYMNIFMVNQKFVCPQCRDEKQMIFKKENDF